MKSYFPIILLASTLLLTACSHKLSESEAQTLIQQASPPGASKTNLTLPVTPELTAAVRSLLQTGNLKELGGVASFMAARAAFFGEAPRDTSSGTVNFNGFSNEYNVTCPLYTQRPVVVSVLNDTKNDLAIVRVRYTYQPLQPFYQKICVEGKARVTAPDESSTREVTFRHFSEGWKLEGGL